MLGSLQALGGTSADRSENLVAGNGTTGLALHRVIDRHDLFPQPALDRRLPLLQRAQTGADDFAGGRTGSPDATRASMYLACSAERVKVRFSRADILLLQKMIR